MALMTRAGRHPIRALVARIALAVVTLLAALGLADGGAVSAQDADRARETARAIEGEIAQSPALPRLIEALRREFPVLCAPETP